MVTPQEIRALYIDTIARGEHARYSAEFELDEAWEDLAEPDRDVFVGNAVDTVDDLAAKGLLPTIRSHWVDYARTSHEGPIRFVTSYSTPCVPVEDEEVQR